jgi:group I intron endonuclease
MTFFFKTIDFVFTRFYSNETEPDNIIKSEETHPTDNNVQEIDSTRFYDITELNNPGILKDLMNWHEEPIEIFDGADPEIRKKVVDAYKNKSGVYAWVLKEYKNPNPMAYIGCCKSLDLRVFKHIEPRGQTNPLFKKDFEKYGIKCFILVILYVSSNPIYDEFEMFLNEARFLVRTKNKYNFINFSTKKLEKAGCSDEEMLELNRLNQENPGQKISEETRQAMSISRQGEKNPRYGVKLNQEHLDAWNAGRDNYLNFLGGREELSRRGKELVGEKNPAYGKKADIQTTLMNGFMHKLIPKLVHSRTKDVLYFYDFRAVKQYFNLDYELNWTTTRYRAKQENSVVTIPNTEDVYSVSWGSANEVFKKVEIIGLPDEIKFFEPKRDLTPNEIIKQEKNRYTSMSELSRRHNGFLHSKIPKLTNVNTGDILFFYNFAAVKNYFDLNYTYDWSDTKKRSRAIKYIIELSGPTKGIRWNAEFVIAGGVDKNLIIGLPEDIKNYKTKNK